MFHIWIYFYIWKQIAWIRSLTTNIYFNYSLSLDPMTNLQFAVTSSGNHDNIITKETGESIKFKCQVTGATGKLCNLLHKIWTLWIVLRVEELLASDINCGHPTYLGLLGILWAVFGGPQSDARLSWNCVRPDEQFRPSNSHN